MIELQRIMKYQISDWLDFSNPVLELTKEESYKIYTAFEDGRKHLKELDV
jgi:hypothetical protein